MTAGTEVTNVINFDAVRRLAADEDRIVRELASRAPSTRYKTSIDSEDSRGPYRYNGTPMVITTEDLANQGRYILFWSGPQNTQWNFPLRASMQQTKSGTIHHVWRDSSRETYYDEPTVAFTFQTGNIMPVRLRQGVQNPDGVSQVAETISLPPGLLDLYDFFEILNAKRILSDGRPNYVYIAYHSLAFPEIFLRGFFQPEGFSFSEDAANPAQVTWQSTFKIHSSEPKFWSSARLKEAWITAFRAQGTLLAQEAGTVGNQTVLGTTGVPVPGQGSGG